MGTQFQILGPLRVISAEGRAIDVGGAKPAAVLAILLLRANELVPTDRLIEDLWDGVPPATAPKTLQVHMSRLRRALTEGQNGSTTASIVTRTGGYSLELDPDCIDAARFERLLAEGTAARAEGEHSRASARLRAALALWRGDALADFAYASFAQEPIGRLDGLRTLALEAAVDSELELGLHSELIPDLKSLVTRHPLSEHLRGQLMIALYRAGRQAEALGIYRMGRRLLVDELGLEPGEELRAIERAILDQDPRLAAPAPRVRSQPTDTSRNRRGALVGYESELTALEAALEQTLTGKGGVCLLAGEPGVGKTRLADELGAVAEARGAEVFWGRCATAGGAPAYWPWIQILRSVSSARDAAAVRTQLGPWASTLAQLVPELADNGDAGKASADGAPEDVRFKLFDAVGSALRRVANATPIVLVLDDIQAADSLSRDLLAFVAGIAIDAPILIVATYRDTELEPEGSLAGTLIELARVSDCLQLVLGGLTADDTAHFVEVSAEVEAMPRLAAAIHDATAGNPLFVSEVVRLLRAENRLTELRDSDDLTLPRGVDQVIQRRLEQLPADCRIALGIASVIGRDFNQELLAQVAKRPLDEVQADLQHAIAARVVEAGAVQDHRFSHDLIRQSLYGALPATDRRKLHAAVADALERAHPHQSQHVIAAVAHHLTEALPHADQGKTVEYLMRAAEIAVDLNGYMEGEALYTKALDIATAGGADRALQCDLALRLVEVYVGEVDPRLKDAIMAADALAEGLPSDPTRDARLAVARAYLLIFAAESSSTEDVYAAIETFERSGDYASAARGYEAVATIMCGCSNSAQMEEAAERMLEAAQRCGSPALTARAKRHMVNSYSQGRARVSEALARSHTLAAQIPDVFTRERVAKSIAVLEAAAGHFDEARATLAEGLALLPPGQRAVQRYCTLPWACRVELLAQNWRRAEELGRELSAYYRDSGLVAYLASEQTFLVDALIAQGRLDEAGELLAEAAPYALADDVDALFRQARSRARLALARGDFEQAEADVRIALAHSEVLDHQDEHTETLLLAARVLYAAGKDSEATDVAAEALRLAENREHAVFRNQARRMLTAVPA